MARSGQKIARLATLLTKCLSLFQSEHWKIRFVLILNLRRTDVKAESAKRTSEYKKKNIKSDDKRLEKLISLLKNTYIEKQKVRVIKAILISVVKSHEEAEPQSRAPENLTANAKSEGKRDDNDQ